AQFLDEQVEAWFPQDADFGLARLERRIQQIDGDHPVNGGAEIDLQGRAAGSALGLHLVCRHPVAARQRPVVGRLHAFRGSARTPCRWLAYPPSPVPPATASSTFTVRSWLPAMTSPSQLSVRPVTAGSLGTPSTSAEPLM